MALTANVSVSLQATQTAARDLGTATFPAALTAALALTSGTGANMADLLWTDTRTLSASASEDLDLSGTLTDGFGVAVSFVEIVAIVVSAAAGNTNDVLVGNATAPMVGGPFGADGSQVIPVKPGGFFVWAAPGATTGANVTDTSAEDLKVANSAGSTDVTYSIAIIGRSA